MILKSDMKPFWQERPGLRWVYALFLLVVSPVVFTVKFWIDDWFDAKEGYKELIDVLTFNVKED